MRVGLVGAQMPRGQRRRAARTTRWHRASLGHSRIALFAGWPIAGAPLAIPAPLFRIINHELHSAIPLPASAENLQEDFSSRLNKDPSTNCRRQPSAGAVYGSQPSMASASPISSSSSSNIVAGPQNPQQFAAVDLLPGSAGRSHKGLVDPGDRCRLARRDLAARERCRDRIHRARHVPVRQFRHCRRR
jgi:hypothetical protein